MGCDFILSRELPIFLSPGELLEGEDSFTGNGSFGDSIGAVESVASMMDGEEKAVKLKVEEMIIDNNEMEDNKDTKMEGEFGFEKKFKTLYCNKTDGKGWQCRNEAKAGHTMCDHHLSLIKSYGNDISSSSFTKKSDKGIAVRRGRARAKKGSSSSSNPYEFYYYSGFGPLWGKRRGVDKINEGKKFEDGDVEDMNKDEKTPSSSQIEDFEFVDDEDDDDDENGDSRKKRIRKPVKARSLKSLM
ncbi:uncharacterized protein LOC123224583 isoform X2 [Mangifera indica]|uniref:uncharacterized protein LOC123224583 isoform X2 n=1 Tax=Mangifera indica TaxID=29780 RepID=UPI001CFC123C|nr:uncharacterized protein LOC123224583 isoform X2 [Mangifera indica]